MRHLIPALAALTVFSWPALGQGAEPSAQYTVRFDATWSSATHPVDFPSTAHFSRLIGGTHGEDIDFWVRGGLAARGIQEMAEMGATSPLRDEVRAAIDDGLAGATVIGDPVPGSPGLAFAEVTVTREFPRVTLVTMIAPSPDWFVGTSGLSLLENDAWLQRKVVPLFAYDAGTDSGSTFNSPNQATVPPEPIARLTTGPVDGAVPFGTFTFERVDLPDPQPLILGDGRFEVTAQWTTLDGASGFGRPEPLSDDTGYFWFFDPRNVELVVKVLDACSFANNFWVFAGGLTNVEVELIVEDTATGDTRSYGNPLETPFQPIQDTAAFATCP